MWLKMFVSVAAALIFVSGSAAIAAEIVVTQKSKKFDKARVTIEKGDSIKFVNSDTIGHNVYSGSPGANFDLGVQKPGTSSRYIFAKDGTFKVRCAIHSRMKVTVTVN